MSLSGQSNNIGQLLQDLVHEASNVLSDGQVTFGEVVHLGGLLAGKANQFAQISGQEKKALVLQAVDIALKKVLEEKSKTLSEEQLTSFRAKIESAAVFVKDTMPAVLDLAVQAARGQLDLRKPEIRKSLWLTIKSLFGCCGVQLPSLPIPVEPVPEALKEPAQPEMTLELSAVESTSSPSPPEESGKSEESRPANETTA
jgi:hypothetical protein